MAQDINKFIDKLSNLVKETEKLGDDSTLIDLINTISTLSDEAGGFGGEISRVVPSNLNMYSTTFQNAYKSLKTAAENAQKGISSLIDYLDNIPIGSLRKKSFDPNSVQEPVAQLNTAPDLSGGPKSAVLNGNDTMEESFYKRDFKLETRLREANENYGNYDFKSITESMQNEGLASDGFELGELSGQSRRMAEQTETDTTKVLNESGSFNFSSWKHNGVKDSMGLDLGAMNESTALDDTPSFVG